MLTFAQWFWLNSSMVDGQSDMLVVVSSFRSSISRVLFLFLESTNTGFEYRSEQSQLQKILDAGGSHPAACAYRNEPNNIQITLGF